MTDHATTVFDPISRRLTSFAVWSIGYGIVWYFGVWRPAPQVAWVNFAIIGAIALGTLPPIRIRPFSAGVAFLSIAAVMFFVMHNTLFAILLAISGVLALSDGAFDFRGNRR